jgi:hypothetical protein
VPDWCPRGTVNAVCLVVERMMVQTSKEREPPALEFEFEWIYGLQCSPISEQHFFRDFIKKLAAGLNFLPAGSAAKINRIKFRDKGKKKKEKS